MLWFQQFSPPSDEGREGVKLQKNATFSLPQSRCARQLPRQREPNETPILQKHQIEIEPKKKSAPTTRLRVEALDWRAEEDSNSRPSGP